MQKHIVRISLGLILVLMFLAHAGKWGTSTWAFQIPIIHRLEAIVYDTRLVLTMPRTVDNRVVILDIDEKSLAEKENGGEGRWPWPRDRMALLLDKLFDHYKIAIIGFDVVFAERDESSGLRVLQQLGQRELKDISGFQSTLKELQPLLEYDQIFGAKMRGRPIVLGYTFTRFEGVGSKKGELPPAVLPAGTFAGRNIDFASYPGYTANLSELQKSAASAGHFSLDPDPDGILRRVPMLAEHNGAYYEPLSLAVVRMILGGPNIVPGYPSDKLWSKNYSGLEWLEVGPLRIPVDEKVNALIPYRGKPRSFEYISAVDVMQQRLGPDQLRGKIVLVGTSAPGLLDLRATPVDEVFPGVEIHANMISGMLDRNLKQKPPYVVGAEFVLLLTVGLAMALLLPLLNFTKSIVVTIAVLLFVLCTNLVVFQYGNLVVPLASGLLLILVLFILNMTYGYFVETRGMRQMTGLFRQYVAPELVDEMAKNPEQFSMKPRAENLSVLFSDVRGFTTISESLSPEDLGIYINDYLTTMSLVMREEHRGTLDKYIGDAIMAFWGAPVGDAEHAKNALFAAMDMQKAAKTLNEKFKAKGWPTFKIGIGVNSGVMRVGNMGSQIRQAYTVMGDPVNLASRLEGITKEYGADIIVGEGTKNAVPGVVFREVDRVRVKGKDEAVAIFEPVGLQGEVEKAKLEEIKLYAQFLRLYRAQDWDQAELQLFNLQKLVPGHALYSQTFVDRIAYLRANPPGQGLGRRFYFHYEVGSMKLRILGCSGGISGDLRTTSMLLDQDVLIDAGTGVGDLSLDALARIDHVFLTHSHLDHVTSIPFLVDTVGWMRDKPLTVHAIEPTLEILREHLFNWKLWPDFTQIPDAHAPFLRYAAVALGETVDLGGRKLTPLPANHVVPAIGYRIDSGRASLVFTGDTTTNDPLWLEVNRIDNLRYLIIETAFCNREKHLAIASKHLCPSMLVLELAKLKRHAEVYITHLKPGEVELTMQEIQECAGAWKPRMLENNQVFEL